MRWIYTPPSESKRTADASNCPRCYRASWMHVLGATAEALQHIPSGDYNLSPWQSLALRKYSESQALHFLEYNCHSMTKISGVIKLKSELTPYSRLLFHVLRQTYFTQIFKKQRSPTKRSAGPLSRPRSLPGTLFRAAGTSGPRAMIGATSSMYENART